MSFGLSFPISARRANMYATEVLISFKIFREINKKLLRIEEDGRYQKLYQKWFGVR